MNNADNSVSIQDCEAQVAMNVEPNKTGTAVKKRDGYAQTLGLCGAGTSTESLFFFTNDNGDEIMFSQEGDGTFCKSINFTTSVQVSTFTAGDRLLCAENDGLAYCFTSGNGAPFSYDGAAAWTLEASDGYPNGKSNVFTEDRQLVIGVAATPNRLFISKSGDPNFFTAGVDNIDGWVEDIGRAGRELTGIYYINGRVIIAKGFSISGMLLDNQYNSQIYSISNNIGVPNQEACVEYTGILYCQASDNHIYALDGSPGGIKKISTKIHNTIAIVPTGKTRINIQTSVSDFIAGNLIVAGDPGAPVSSDITIGSLVPSSWTFADNSTVTFGAGTLTDLGLAVGSVVSLSSNPIQDDFEDGDITANPIWTVTDGSMQIVDTAGTNWMRAATNTDDNVARTSSTISSGTWTWDTRYTDDFQGVNYLCNDGTSVCWDYRFMVNKGGDYYSIQAVAGNSSIINTFNIRKKEDGTVSTLATDTTTYEDFGTHSWRVDRSSLGLIELYKDGAFFFSTTDTDITSTTVTEIALSRDDAKNQFNYFDNVYMYGYASSGTFISQIFNTNFTTPTSGEFRSTFSYTADDSGSEITFQVRSSLAGDDTGWTDWVPTSDTLRAGGTQQYIQYRAQFSTIRATHTPTLTEVGLHYATTGTFITQCIQPGSGISAFGTLDIAAELDGNSRLDFEDAVGADCDNLGAYSSVSTGTTIAQSASAAYSVKIIWENLPSATNTARVDAISTNWTEGSVAPARYAEYHNDWLIFSVSTGGSTNDTQIRFSTLGLGFWLTDIKSTALFNFDDTLYFGNPSDNKVYRFSPNNPEDALTSDDGADINATWKSKNFRGASPFEETNWRAVSTVANQEGGGDLQIKWEIDGMHSQTYSVSLSTGATVIRNNSAIRSGQRGTYFNVEYSNNSTEPWEVLGTRIDGTPIPWRPLER